VVAQRAAEPGGQHDHSIVDGSAFFMDIVDVDVQREQKLWPGKTVSVHFAFSNNMH